MNTSIYDPFGFSYRFAGNSSSTARRRKRGRILASVLLWICLPFLAMWSLPVLAIQPVSFAPQTLFAARGDPNSVVAADFNGDGNTDVAAANKYSNNVSVLLGDGNGGFAPQTTFASGVAPNSVATADFNGDGKIDIITANEYSNNVSVLLGDGNGGFGAETRFAVGSFPASVATADFNGDGNIDVVTANAFSHNVSILLGNGRGGFAPQTTFNELGAPWSVTTADFNGDGNTDLATVDVYGGADVVSVLLGNGNGSFAPKTTFAVGRAPWSVTTADFNNDGHIDLATANRYSTNVSVLLGDGRGGFAPQTRFAVRAAPISVATADFNGDGHMDLVAANSESSNVSVLLGNGNGSFAPQTTFASGVAPLSVATADFNSDGKTDLVTANSEDNNVSVLLNTTTPHPLFSALPDINHDGSPELAAVRYDIGFHKTTAQVKNAKTGVLVKEMAFNGQFVPKFVRSVPDLNGNGAAELAVLGIRNSDQAVRVEIRDSRSGVKLSAVPFPASVPPIGLNWVRNGKCSGNTCLLVLQQNDNVLRAQIKDALTGNLIRNIAFAPGYKCRNLLVIKSLNRNQSPELALLADNKIPSEADKVEIRDSKTGRLIRNIHYEPGKPVSQLRTLPDLNDNGDVELVTLLPNDAQIVLVDAKTGVEINTLNTTLTQPYFLGRVNDKTSGSRLALLGKQATDGQIRAEVYDSLTGAVVKTIVFSEAGTTIGFTGIADINGNGTSELKRVIKRQHSQQTIVEIRDGATGELINIINF
ncbi:MAG: FG-GAP repeat domain-containing protein [Gammaproteobacteria bacterium]